MIETSENYCDFLLCSMLQLDQEITSGQTVALLA